MDLNDSDGDLSQSSADVFISPKNGEKPLQDTIIQTDSAYVNFEFSEIIIDSFYMIGDYHNLFFL